MNPLNSIKTNYEITLTQQAWAELENIAKQFNVSISELFEQIGDKKLAIVDLDDLEDALDVRDAIEAEANPENQERLPWAQVKQELGLVGSISFL